MAKKKIAEFVECMRFQRCDAVKCDVREWHRHEVMEREGLLRILGPPELLEKKLDPPSEPEPQPPPPVTDFED